MPGRSSRSAVHRIGGRIRGQGQPLFRPPYLAHIRPPLRTPLTPHLEELVEPEPAVVPLPDTVPNPPAVVVPAQHARVALKGAGSIL